MCILSLSLPQPLDNLIKENSLSILKLEMFSQSTKNNVDFLTCFVDVLILP